MKLAAGAEIYHDWRIHINDQLEAASWENYGYLLKWSKTPLVVPGLFDRVKKIALEASRSRPPDIHVLLEPPVSGRAAYAVIVSRTSDERTETVYLTDVPDSISKLVAELYALGVPMTAPAPGKYLWVEPSEQPADPARDLNGDQACSLPWVNAAAQAIASGSLITPLGDRLHAESPPISQVVSLKARSGWYAIAHIEAQR